MCIIFKYQISTSTTAGGGVTSEITEVTTSVIDTTTKSETTTASCPISQLEGNQIALVCPTGFRRHPKYCDLFYQCTSNSNNDIKVLVMSCPSGTVFDDSKIQCLPPEEVSKPCNGEISESVLLRTLEDNSLLPVSELNG